MIDLDRVDGFDWDRDNQDKSYHKHGISIAESEELFLDENILFAYDIKHSQTEDRFIAVGKNLKNKIRIVSVRPANAIPHFRSEKAERKFWLTHDSTEYVDYSKAIRVKFPNLKLTSRPITLRLPQ